MGMVGINKKTALNLIGGDPYRRRIVYKSYRKKFQIQNFKIQTNFKYQFLNV